MRHAPFHWLPCTCVVVVVSLPRTPLFQLPSAWVGAQPSASCSGAAAATRTCHWEWLDGGIAKPNVPWLLGHSIPALGGLSAVVDTYMDALTTASVVAAPTLCKVSAWFASRTCCSAALTVVIMAQSVTCGPPPVGSGLNTILSCTFGDTSQFTTASAPVFDIDMPPGFVYVACACSCGWWCLCMCLNVWHRGHQCEHQLCWGNMCYEMHRARDHVWRWYLCIGVPGAWSMVDRTRTRESCCRSASKFHDVLILVCLEPQVCVDVVSSAALSVHTASGSTVSVPPRVRSVLASSDCELSGLCDVAITTTCRAGGNCDTGDTTGSCICGVCRRCGSRQPTEPTDCVWQLGVESRRDLRLQSLSGVGRAKRA